MLVCDIFYGNYRYAGLFVTHIIKAVPKRVSELMTFLEWRLSSSIAALCYMPRDQVKFNMPNVCACSKTAIFRMQNFQKKNYVKSHNNRTLGTSNI